MVERADPQTVLVLGGDDADVRRYIESDFKIRSGMCPNGHGLMIEEDGTQHCPKCNFVTNVLAEKGAPS
jgi:hypothetical protein